MYFEYKKEIKEMQKNGAIFFIFDMKAGNYEVINVEKKVYDEQNDCFYNDFGYKIIPKFKNKELVKEFEREHKIYSINEMEMNDDLKDWLKENVMTMEQFEVMVRNWDDKRKLKEVVNNKNRKKKVRIM